LRNLMLKQGLRWLNLEVIQCYKLYWMNCWNEIVGGLRITQSNEDPVLPQVMSVLFMCGQRLFISGIVTSWGCWIHDRILQEMYADIFVQHGQSLWCPLHALFVIKCYPLHVKIICTWRIRVCAPDLHFFSFTLRQFYING
jgi:hypothetical protein